jgi:hypothetical protein
MFRIFYHPESGIIERLVTAEFAVDLELPYIDVPDQIRIDAWRVNADTQTIYSVPIPDYPTRGG